jgi:hypothetical protein
MALSTPKYLELLEKLSRCGVESRLAEHTVVARGFADIGAEEYALLSRNKLVSLTSGAVSQLPDEHRHFFFDVRSLDELIELVLERGGTCEGISFLEQREWEVRLSRKSGMKFAGRGEVLDEAVAEAVLAFCSEKN